MKFHLIVLTALVMLTNDPPPPPAPPPRPAPANPDCECEQDCMRLRDDATPCLCFVACHCGEPDGCYEPWPPACKK